MQQTIAKEIKLSGIGIHSGKEVVMICKPASIDFGIVFQSQNGQNVSAKFDNVSCTNMSTKLTHNEFSVDVVEHLMAAIWGLNIDNMLIELNSCEVPIYDGSAIDLMNEIQKAGIVKQQALRKTLYVLQPVNVVDGDKSVTILPNDQAGIIIDMTIDFENPIIGKQRFIFNSSTQSFENDIASARTFGFAKDLEYLHSNGLALGASMNNCIGIDDNGAMVELRFADEFVRHKVLDCIGDLFLSGYYLSCIVVAHKTGHKLNNMLLRKLFESKNNYEVA